jgi:hypothetical protein
MSTAYVPHVVYSLAFISLSTHLLWQRKAADTQRAQINARLSVLESLAGRLRAGEQVPQGEIDRLQNLVRGKNDSEAAPRQGSLLAEEVGWKDVFFGRSQPAERLARSDLHDQKDLEACENQIHNDIFYVTELL